MKHYDLDDAERYMHELIKRMQKNPNSTERDMKFLKYILNIIQADRVFNRMDAVNKQLKEESCSSTNEIYQPGER